MDTSNFLPYLSYASALAPAVLMGVASLVGRMGNGNNALGWRQFHVLSGAALVFALVTAVLSLTPMTLAHSKPSLPVLSWLAVTPFGMWVAVLVQLLGSIIGGFSSRYLQGEPGVPRYVAALSGVLTAVHVLLLANHWVILVVAWALVGAALRPLLCFYPDRPFALLAAHKKRVTDRLADVLLVTAAALAWWQVGSGSLSDLWQYLAINGASTPLQISAICLVLAVMLRTALLPMHGWLIQVMEAPTPVSALLHAGVVNLGGFVLIRFAPLLDAAPVARWLLVAFGLATALLAGMVMLTRVSIKVRLAWSTVAQMGFMVLECGLGLYTLAALHLIGHSLYKTYAFLSASTVVQQTKLRMMRGDAVPSLASLIAAPALAAGIVALVHWGVGAVSWPWWWSGVLALAWSPSLWMPVATENYAATYWWRGLAAVGMLLGLTTLAFLLHHVPLGVSDVPNHNAGVVTLIGMALVYVWLCALQRHPERFVSWRRWTYAGYYVDELFTRLTLRMWPTHWSPAGNPQRRVAPLAVAAVAATTSATAAAPK